MDVIKMMNNNNLKQLLNEYSKKRDYAIFAAEKRKDKLYSQYPKIKELDTGIQSSSILLAKSLLTSTPDVLDLKNKIIKLKAEKNNILAQLNIKQSYFEPKYDCDICKDTGYIIKNNQSFMCNCLKQKLLDIEYNNLNTYNMKNQTFNKFNINLYTDKSNPEKYNSNISPRENIEIIKKICDNFITNFDDFNQKNLLFTGNSGLGKTFLSSCISNELIKLNKTVLYQTSPIMLDSIIDYRLRKNNKQYQYYQ